MRRARAMAFGATAGDASAVTLGTSRVWGSSWRDTSRPGILRTPGLSGHGRLLGVVDLGCELPVALAVCGGGVDRVDRDDLLARVAVLVERDRADDRVVLGRGVRSGDADGFLERVLGRIGRGGALDRV